MSFHEDLISSSVKNIPHAPNREMVVKDFTETFGIKLAPVMEKREPKKDKNGNIVFKTRPVKAFAEPGPLTPEINPHYRFPKNETLMFLLGLEEGHTMYLQGHSGTGKSELCNQIAARLNYNVVQVNFDGHLLRSDLVGEMKIQEGSTKFRYGLVPLGFTLPGTLLLFDEVDAVAPETAFVLQRAVSADRKFLMHETNEQFHLHPQNAIAATANTSGMGDDSGLYVAGTNVQNFSFQNRWDTVMKIDYLSKDIEAEILSEMFITEKDRKDAKAVASLEKCINSVCAVMALAREGYQSGTLSTPLTTRDAIRWMAKLRKFPFPMLCAEFSFLNRLSIEDAMCVAETINDNFGLPEKDIEMARYMTRAAGKKSL